MSSGQEIPDLQVVIYPSSGGNKAFTILISDTLLVVKHQEIDIQSGQVILGKEVYSNSLVISVRDKNRLMQQFNRSEFHRCEVEFSKKILDSWIFDITIGKEYFGFSSMTLAECKKAKRAVKCLLKKVSKPIKLDGFS